MDTIHTDDFGEVTRRPDSTIHTERWPGPTTRSGRPFMANIINHILEAEGLPPVEDTATPGRTDWEAIHAEELRLRPDYWPEEEC